MTDSIHIVHLNRIERVLDYIHSHLEQPLSVAHLAEHSCWSRWQLQRVFLAETGFGIAQYVRQLRLSNAASRLLTSTDRHVDIALACGFKSEISFSRSFKQFFSCSPSKYRQRGKFIGLLMPISKAGKNKNTNKKIAHLIKVHVETKPEFKFIGLSTSINGIFSISPDFSSQVPSLWQQLNTLTHPFHPNGKTCFGILDVAGATEHTDKMTYWAGYNKEDAVELDEINLEHILIPKQLYAVINFVGPIAQLPDTLDWFIHHWLPESDYDGIEAFDIEYYGPNFDLYSSKTAMQYWVPIKHR